MQYVVNVGYERHHPEIDSVKIFLSCWGNGRTDTNNMEKFVVQDESTLSWILWINDLVRYVRFLYNEIN